MALITSDAHQRKIKGLALLIGPALPFLTHPPSVFIHRTMDIKEIVAKMATKQLGWLMENVS